MITLLQLAVAAMAGAAIDDASFRKSIEPILVGRCLECHGAERKGGLDLRQSGSALSGGESGAAIVPGDPGASLLYRHVSEGEMPPKHPLPDDEVDRLRLWIANGAYFPESPIDPFAITTSTRAGYDWWSLQPIVDITPPENPEAPATWSEQAIDRFVYSGLRANGLRPNDPAPPRTLIRRATYDLTGLPPTPEEIDAFEVACAAETGSSGGVGTQAYENLLERLLASPHYGERWGRHWLDVVRFGESTGYEVNHIVDNLWPYRDYVIRSFNEDKPYDRFVVEQIAGDSVDDGNPEVEIGMAFLVAGPHDIVGNQDPVQAAQIRANTVDEMIRTASDTFMGLTVGCARCHDHKFDPISQKDYYRLYATFGGVYPADRLVATDAQREEREAKVVPLRAKRDAVRTKRDALNKSIQERAESKSEEYETRWTRDAVARTGTTETFAPVRVQHVRLIAEGVDTNPDSRTNFRIDEFEVWTAGDAPRNVALAANGGTAQGASRVAQDFADAYGADVVIDGVFGEKWIAQRPELTISLAQPETVDRVLFSSDRPNALGSFGEAAFVCEYRIEVSEDGETWTEVATSHDRKPSNDRHRRKRLFDREVTDAERAELAAFDRETGEIEREIRAVPVLPSMRVGRLEQPGAAFHVFQGGDPQRPGDEVVPSSLDVLARVAEHFALDGDAAEKERRLAFARWLVAPENPLTPRVMVNRLWHYHFGAGIVPTPSDFGYMGGQPSHPELLDWLARDFVDGGWQVKRMHRQIMLSQAYRQASTGRADAAKVDQRARYLWRFPPRRLSGEEIRDSMLQVTGKLNTARGGPGFRLYRYLRDNVSTYVPMDTFPPETYRRSVYHQNVRAARVDLMTDYDAPDCALSAPRRVTTTSPLQALTSMNHQFTLDMATALAERVSKEAESTAGRVERAFLLAFGRSPSADETTLSTRMIEQHGLPAFCRGLFNTNEFIYLD